MQDLASLLLGWGIFSRIDFVPACNHTLLWKKAMRKTAVTTPLEVLDFLRIPFGLGNTAQILQRFIHQVTRGLEKVHVHADDVVVKEHSEERRPTQLRALFHCPSKRGSTINTSNCELENPSVTF